jgi:pilus assembly protein Flp/PilA
MLRLITRTDSALRALIADRKGATAIEYGLIAAGIAVAIIAAVFALGSDISNFFNGLGTQLNAKTPL